MKKLSFILIELYFTVHCNVKELYSLCRDGVEYIVLCSITRCIQLEIQPSTGPLWLCSQSECNNLLFVLIMSN